MCGFDSLLGTFTSELLAHSHTLLQIQIVLLVILLVAITNFVIGTFLYRGPDSQETQRGFTGYSGE